MGIELKIKKINYLKVGSPIQNGAQLLGGTEHLKSLYGRMADYNIEARRISKNVHSNMQTIFGLEITYVNKWVDDSTFNHWMELSVGVKAMSAYLDQEKKRYYKNGDN